MSILLQPEQIDDLMKAYDSLKESTYARLILGPRISDYLLQIILADDNGTLRCDASGLQALTDAGIPFVSGNREGSAAADMMFGDAGANLLRGGDGDDMLSGGDGDDTLYGGDGNDLLRGDAGNDLLDGGRGSNRLDGGAGNDVLKVTWYANNNVLIGGTDYVDTYLFNKGDGYDTIVEQSGSNRIVFGEGLHREEAVFRKSGDDLSILFNHGDDQVTVAGWFSSSDHQVESFVFTDGPIMSSEVQRLIAAMTSAVTTTQASVRDTQAHPMLVASSIV
ncbi:MAG TPA: calcium-binding protein [Xylella sp.]